jgi:hypothetical protein
MRHKSARQLGAKIRCGAERCQQDGGKMHRGLNSRKKDAADARAKMILAPKLSREAASSKSGLIWAAPRT